MVIKRKSITIIGIIVLLLGILTITLILIFSDKTKRTILISPYTFNTGYAFEKEDSLVSSTIPKSFELITLVKDSESWNFDLFLEILGFDPETGDTFSGQIIEWQNENGYVSYDKLKNQISFSLIDPVQVSDFSDLLEYNNNEVSDSFTSFFEKYLGENLVIFDTSTIVSGSNYTMKIRRDYQGIPIEVEGCKNCSDYLVVNKQNGLIGGKVTRIDTESATSTNYDIVKWDQLLEYLAVDEYPKTIIYDENLNIKVAEMSDELPVGVGDEAYYQDGVDSKVISIREYSYIYYYIGMNNPYLFPTYKIKGNMDITYPDQTITNNMVIYANAIDPDYVQIPDPSYFEELKNQEEL